LQHITAITSRSELNRKLKPHSIVHRQMPASPTSTKSGAIPSRTDTVPLPNWPFREAGFSKDAKNRALQRLEQIGSVRVIRHGKHSPQVKLTFRTYEAQRRRNAYSVPQKRGSHAQK